MSAANFHRNHAKHISFSEKLNENLQKSGQNLLYLLSQQTSDRLLIKVINIIVGGIYAVIPDLQEIVIKNYTHEENNADLKNVVKKLSQYTNEMVQVSDSDSGTQLQALKDFIQNILVEGESLLDIIKKDDLHDFKHELVAHLKEITFTIERGQARLQVEGYTQQELKNVVEGLQQDNLKEFSTIENHNLEHLKAMAIHIKHIAKHDLHLAFYLNKVASNFHDIEIQNKISKAASILNAATADILQINDKLIDTKETVAALTRWCLDGWNSVADLYEFIDNNRIADNKHSENLKDIIKSVVSHGIVITIHTKKGIQDESAHA